MSTRVVATIYEKGQLTQKLLDRLVDLHALGQIVVDPLKVKGAELLAVAVQEGIVRAELFEGVDVTPEGIRRLERERER